MRFLLLLFFLSFLWSVHSVHKFKHFKKFKFDKEKCATDYFCILPPTLSMLADTRTELVNTPSLSANQEHEIGIYIKPISPSKWILILYSESQLDNAEGIYLSQVERGATKAVASASFRKQSVVVGCLVEFGTNLLKPLTKAGLTYELWEYESKFKLFGMMKCAGVLTSNDGSDLTEIFNSVQTATHHLRIFYKINDANLRMEDVVRTLYKRDTTTALMFGDVKDRLTCDFEKLKIPLRAFSRFHLHHEAMTISNSIDCPQYTTAGGKFDLLINTGDIEKTIVAQKITCEKEIVHGKYKFYYHKENGSPTEITGDAFVACGERFTCSKLDEFECKKNKEFCSSPTSDCNANGASCNTMKCPSNQWIINVNETISKYTGEIICRKESIEDESKIGWFPEKSDSLAVDEAICYMKTGCQTKHPIKTKCAENRENCAPATITEKKVYCPGHYDMMFKSKEDGSEVKTDKFQCDSKTETWIGPNARTAESVFCMYNKTKHDLLRANLPVVEEKTDKPMNTFTFILWALVGFMALFMVVCILVFGFSRIVEWRATQVWEAKMAKFRDVQHRNETERYRLRNPNDRNELHDMLVSLPDISKLSTESLCRGFKLDFGIYSPREREKFLINCLNDWGFGKAKHIKLTIPCIRKCLELERPGNCCYPPLHEAPVRASFMLLKVLSGAFSQHGDTESEQKIKEAIGIKAKNIIYSVGLDRLEEEDIDMTNLRNHALEAALFSGHKEYTALLVKMAHEKQRNIGTPLRRYAWAAYVKWGDAEAIDRVRAWFAEEVKLREKGMAPPDDDRFGTKIEHYIFALVAGERGKVESFFSYLVANPLFTGKHLMVAFRSMLEVFDEHQITARFLFMDRHLDYKHKLPIASDDYLLLWKWIYTYIIYFPTNPYWLFRHYSSFRYFNKQEKEVLKIPFGIATTFGGMYMNIYKWKDIIDVIDYELMEIETLKKDERKPDPNAVEEEPPPVVPFQEDPNCAKMISMRREQEKKEAEEARRREKMRDDARQKHREEKDRKERAEAAADAELAALLEAAGLKTGREKEKEPEPKEVTAEDDGAVEKTPPSDKSGPPENPVPATESAAPAPDMTQKSEKSEKSQTGGATMTTGGKSATGQTTGTGPITGGRKK